ncbi:hypothetical protein F7Q99_23090 [Streptomyces kaniharaensis]|uniref:Uncharacterized protein n=1 Tax=Streptomyces kaniharaensis TaxID=212423 RepID=A0A6N7KWT6_9ACTN|nr:hypothetical protein [Streptomyces kaniharaensis]MQS15069.1 hypothetical protein [Streptomyces kaniharaensis]
MRGCIARKIAAFGVAAAATLGVLGTTTLPAAADPIADHTVIAGQSVGKHSITASYHCVITADYGWRWEGECNVYSGQLRTITYCADGSHTTGLWIGARPQAWDVWGNCPGSSWTRIVFQTRG